METFKALNSLLLILLCCCLTLHSTNAVNYTETLTMGQSVGVRDTFVSANGKFELGFFSRKNSTKYYVGIWFKKVPKDNIVWVANREYPSPDNSSAIFTIDGNGNLVVKDDRMVYYLTEFSNMGTTHAMLLDSGNLILLNNSNLNILWQSFDHPTDTLLPGMDVWSVSLRAWTSIDDPSPGAFSLEPYYPYDLCTSRIIKRGSDIYMIYNGFCNVSYTSRLVLEVSGELKQQFWLEDTKEWISLDSSTCSQNASCGSFSICNPQAPDPCECLEGFTPYDSDSWKKGNTSTGCVRKKELQCTNTSDHADDGLDEDGYFSLYQVDFVSDNLLTFEAQNTSTCERACSKDCSCVAYAFNFTITNISYCLLWHDQILNLINDTVHVRDDPTGQKINVRDDPHVVDDSHNTSSSVFLKLAASELNNNGTNSRNKPSPKQSRKKIFLIIFIVVLLVVLLSLALFSYYYYKRKLRGRGEDLRLFDVGMSMKVKSSEFTDSDKVAKVNKREVKLPLFSFSSVSAATENFSAANKLGEGGFGPVYKGKLLNGDEVAVKRLSARSGQGWEELKNEALLIAKLQHNNLVRLFGCCIEGDEKMLIYEFMPNKSLDFFLFDATKSKILDWGTRVRVIDGIAQGLLYLHQYSRFRIIHRDLKVSNILLDVNMNPKISDFGLARMFGGDELQANTNRIVGTYGYMSPEYALEGLFSIKSDVFSFGVLLLEIISGRKNTGFYNRNSLNLLGYAWELWTSGRGTELIDSAIVDASIKKMEVERYVNIALLCVQERADDRPTMSDVVSMLGNETAILPPPKLVAFINVSGMSNSRSVGSSAKSDTKNVMTTSVMEAR